ncbi:MAG: alanine--tRNA ligase [Planctomycetota bacterium]
MSNTTAPSKTVGRHNAARVRQDFLEFFGARGHAIVPSSPVFPQDDPTLLFTNAGMNQFKDVFLGTGTRPYRRAVDTQKCIRVSGKHNDLEEVGVDTYHHTFFEMLGNWSFGDYFKEDAIPWAWELLTQVWGLPKDRLWVTVFGGDEKDGLPVDTEAERIWIEKAGISPDRVLRFGRKDNFWEMGDTGPCGPCTEIHIDRGDPSSDPMDGRDRKIGVNAGNERFMELWNNVFMEFNRLDDGSLRKLPAQSVDTGMGFERILSVLQGKRSNYDTDLFTPIFTRLESVSGRSYGAGTSRSDIAFRVCADHVRAVTSAIADGALPSNTGRGYVLRRLIRRAARFGRQELGAEDPFLFELVPTVGEVLGGTFPEMRVRADFVRSVVQEEEKSFGRTLGRGLARFGELRNKVVASGAKTIPGDAAFELYATYGFPRDLVELMAREQSVDVDASGWETAEKSHQDASRAEGKFKQLLSAEELAGLSSTRSTYHEDGAAATRIESELVFFADAALDGKSRAVLAQSPFYPEGGGQVGDSGTLQDASGRWRFVVEDARRIGPVVVHLGRAEGTTAPVGQRVIAEVDVARRERTKKNHTATHLMHKALKEVLGDHVGQQGSYVGPDRLRFDFTHPRAVTPDEIEKIERIVNHRVFQNAQVKTTVEDLDAAKARGVVAMFGEKYDAQVRVLDVGGWSMELCGGTHVRAAGDIGPFVITLERAVSAGVRRIEALTGPAAVEEMQRQRRLVTDASRLLKASPEQVSERIQALQDQVKEARKKTEASSGGDSEKLVAELRAAPEMSGVRALVTTMADADAKSLADAAERARGEVQDFAIAIFGKDGAFVVACAGQALKRGLGAGALVQAVNAAVGSKGGGNPEKAQGRIPDPAKVGVARELVEKAIAARLASS